jgi:hypothetical protein
VALAGLVVAVSREISTAQYLEGTILIFTQRSNLVPQIQAREFAIGFAFLAVLLCCGSTQAVVAQGRGGELPSTPSKPTRSKRPQPRIRLIQTYVTWLDKETIVLAMSSPASKGRIVIGIGTLPTDETLPTNLYQIQGFGELVPLSALSVFRLALAGKPQYKYKVTTLGAQGGTSISLGQIDQRFRDYVRITTAKPGDLEVWDVLSDAGQTRVIILGDFVLVRPAEASNAQSKAENAMFELLTKMALDENKGSRLVSLQGGCRGTTSIIEAVQESPFSGESRWKLRDAVTGKITGASDGPANEYLVMNSGWVNRVLHLDVKPTPADDSRFKVMAVVGEKEEPILGQRDLELPPCEGARISVEPQHWYYELRAPVDFRYDEKEAKLSVIVLEAGLNWFLMIVGAALITSTTLLIWLVLTFIPNRRAPKKQSGEIIRPLIQPEKSASKTSSAKTLKKKSRARADSEPSPDIRAPESLPQATRDYKQRLEGFTSQVEAALPRLESIDRTPAKLLELQDQLDAERTEHKRWRDCLKELGDSPEAIVKNWQELKKEQRHVSKAQVQLTPPATDERVFRARLVSRDIKKAGEQLIEIEKLDARYASLFTGTGLELSALASQLSDAASSSDATLTWQLKEQVRLLNSELSQQERMDQVLRAFLRQLLMQEYVALLSMLRLWQVIEIYCCDSKDPLAAAFHIQSKEYRRTCVQFLSDFDCLQVHFHKIRFLEDPVNAGLTFTESPSVPPIQNNPMLFAIIRNRLDSTGGSNYWRTTADVALWGFECSLDPGLNCETQLWLWRSAGLG